MAVVLSDDREEVVYKTKRRETGVTCDICGDFISADANDVRKRKYFEVTTGHHDWGNDSWESVVEKDVCPKCVNSFVTGYLDSIKNKYGTEYIDIHTEYTHPRYHWDD